MDKFTRYVAIYLVLQLVMSSCTLQNNGEIDGTDMQWGHIVKTDSMMFKHDAPNGCRVKSIVDVEYPEFYRNDTLTAQLQAAYVKSVLEMPDTLSIDNAVSEVLARSFSRYGDYEDSVSYYTTAYNGKILECADTVEIKKFKNEYGILSFCSHSVVTKNGEKTVDTHRYINIDLQTMKRIEAYDLFKEMDFSDVSELLKAKLLRQMNVKDEDELIEKGYFNLDNIMVNNNFYFDNEGITWNYVAYEVACYSVGETQIKLNYEELNPYVAEGSVLSNLIKKTMQ